MASTGDERGHATRSERGPAAARGRQNGRRPCRPGRGRAGPAESRRSHEGTWVPVPHRRRLEASPAALLRRRSLRSAAPVSVSRLNIGPLSQRSMNGPTSPDDSSWSAMASSAARRSSRRPSSSMPAVTPMNTRVADATGRSPAPRGGRRAPRANNRARHRAPHRARLRTASATRPAVAGRSARTASEPPWPGRSTATDAEVLLELLAEGTPESARLGEAVQHHQRPARAAYLDMEWHVG